MRIHIVQKGDTLWTIAKKYGVNFDELKKLNAQLSNPDLIMPGMKIKVPTPAGSPKKEMPKKAKEAPIVPSPAPVKEQPVPVPPIEIEEEQPMPISPVTEQPMQIPPAKEQPKPVSPVKEQPMPVSPVKKQPKPAMPPLPPIIPEVEINQIFQMNMNQMQQTVQPQAPPSVPNPPAKPNNIFPGLGKKEEEIESPSLPIAPPPMPEMEMAPQLQGGCTYQMNPWMNMHQMAPQVQGYGMHPGLYPHWCVPMPMQPSYGAVENEMMQAPHSAVENKMMESPEQTPPNYPMMESPEQTLPNYPMMESPEQIPPNYPMMHYPSPDQVQGMQEQMQAMPMPYAPQMYPAPSYPMQPYPTPGNCVPVTPVMPGSGYCPPYGMGMMPHPPMGYGMESPEYMMPSNVMGANQPMVHPAMMPPNVMGANQPMVQPANVMGANQPMVQPANVMGANQPMVQPANVMGANQPMIHPAHMNDYYHHPMMHPSYGMAMPYQQPPSKLPGQSGCGSQRFDEEDEE
ncbi:SafA/ExsA family spore coat assembly protein [Bacillus sp. B190/17]|uniref:SafA/ExsA family spore coat assembly protein n=1 Tax=Bacillus lumedeiriae TaxID=3058829 RepID=A0ABW8I4T6_9BACI